MQIKQPKPIKLTQPINKYRKKSPRIQVRGTNPYMTKEKIILKTSLNY